MRRLRSPVRWLAAPETAYRVSRNLFLRFLAGVFIAAFASLAVQARGLVGAGGILPFPDLLDAASRQWGAWAPLHVPTLLWLWRDDAALLALCALGIAAATSLLLGFAPRACLALLWGLYLSLTSAGQIFLSFQWDVLLLETAVVAWLMAPSGAWLHRGTPPSRASLWLLRWLLFRVMFLSGAVKLLSGDETWRGLTALELHYWTQPLPNPWSPLFHELPHAVHVASCVATLGLELLLPLAIFAPARARRVAALGFLAFQVLINLSGNYGFFGWLTGALCIPLIDDRVWRRVLGRSAPRLPGASVVRAASPPSSDLRSGVLAVATAALLVLTSSAAALRLGVDLPRPLEALQRAAAPFRSFNAYGLFAVMTRDRPEIEIEASQDGRHFEPYRFRYKPDRVDEPPRFVTLHMPRLDWQMWFAALRPCSRSSWVLALQKRLLEASPPVLGLFEAAPFGKEAPRFVRTRLFRYEFASRGERRRGLWWRRTELGPYCPPLRLENGRLVRARLPEGRGEETP